jgi:uncharacterized protein
MIEKIVVDTSPIIALGQMYVFETLEKLEFEFVCPKGVEEEISAGFKQGFPVDMPAYFRVLSLKSPLSLLTIETLDKGEAAVIQLAIERNIKRVCIDDLKGRRAATAVGLEVIGSLGLIGKAKKMGIISEIRPLIERAKKAGIFYDRSLIETFLSKFGE